MGACFLNLHSSWYNVDHWHWSLSLPILLIHALPQLLSVDGSLDITVVPTSFPIHIQCRRMGVQLQGWSYSLDSRPRRKRLERGSVYVLAIRSMHGPFNVSMILYMYYVYSLHKMHCQWSLCLINKYPPKCMYCTCTVCVWTSPYQHKIGRETTKYIVWKTTSKKIKWMTL